MEILRFHESCRKRYAASSSQHSGKRKVISPLAVEFQSLDDSVEEPSTSRQRISQLSSSTEDFVNDFNFKELCFLCASPLDKYHKKVCTVKHEDFKEKICAIAEKKEDENAKIILSRLQAVTSFITVKVSYHRNCYKSFVKPITEENISEKKKTKKLVF